MNAKQILIAILLRNCFTQVFSFTIDVYSKKNFAGDKTTLNITDCLSILPPYVENNIVSISNGGYCVILYNGRNCKSKTFVKLTSKDPNAADLSEYGMHTTTKSISECYPCPIKEGVGPWRNVQTYEFQTSEGSYAEKKFSNSNVKDELQDKNYCAEFSHSSGVTSVDVYDGCVQFYTTKDCSVRRNLGYKEDQTVQVVTEMNRRTFAELGITRSVKSFSHCNFQCEKETIHITLKGTPIVFNIVRLDFKNASRKQAYGNWKTDGGCYNPAKAYPHLGVPTKLIMVGICLIIFPNYNCNRNPNVMKPMMMNASIGEVLLYPPFNSSKSSPILSFMTCEFFKKFEYLPDKDSPSKLAESQSLIQIYPNKKFNGNITETIDFDQNNCAILNYNLTSTSSINTDENCIYLFTNSNCSCPGERILPGSPVMRDVSLFKHYADVKSVATCSGNVSSCNSHNTETYSVKMKTRLNDDDIYYTIESGKNESDICWELPSVLLALEINSIKVSHGCVRLYWDFGCSEFGQHVTITQNMNADELTGKWDPYHSVGGNVDTYPGSISGCQLNYNNVTRLEIPEQRIHPVIRWTGGFVKMESGFTHFLVDNSCTNIFRPERRFDWFQNDEVAILSVKEDCFYFFDENDCTCSPTALPFKFEAESSVLVRNVASHPLWNDTELKIKSVFRCTHFFWRGGNPDDIKTSSDSTFGPTTDSDSSSSLSQILVILVSLVVIITCCATVAIRRKTIAFNPGDTVIVSANNTEQVNMSVEMPLQTMATTPTQNQIWVSPQPLKLVSSIPLGGGSYGKVYKALHLVLNEYMAVKHILLYKALQACNWNTELDLLFREMRHLHEVEHLNVVKFYNCWIEGSEGMVDKLETIGISQWTSTNGEFSLFIQMEFCNSTLDVWLKDRPTLEIRWMEGVTSIFRQILQGLNAIHAKDIVHRDIKPTNIFYKEINGTKVWKIGDLGLSRKMGQSGYEYEDLSHAGNINYRSPEMSREVDYSFKTDIYSVGLVFLEILVPELVNCGKKIRVYRNILESENLAGYLPLLFESEFTLDMRRKQILFEILEGMLNSDPEFRSQIQEILKLLDTI